MTVAVAIEAAVIVVLGVFVTGLLRSYSGLLARVEQLAGDAGARRAVETPVELSGISNGAGLTPSRAAAGPAPSPGADHHPASDLQGTTPDGDPRVVAVKGVGHQTLLAFLSSTCTTCARFWEEFRLSGPSRVPAGTRLIVVTKGAEAESPSSVQSLAPPLVEVVMTTDAWVDYAIPGSPYFVYVDGPSGEVAGEGTAVSWTQVLNLMALAGDDASVASGVGRRKASSDVEREADVDRALMQAGIFPGDPSLYPTGEGTRT